MPNESTETRLARLEEYRQNVKDQLGRIISHLESEQRVYGGHGKRIDLMEKLFEKMQRDNEIVERLLRDDEKGLSVRMDRIEQQQKSSSARIERWISILAVILSLVSILSQYVK
jgi:chaperonin cofactor prefoldin